MRNFHSILRRAAELLPRKFIERFLRPKMVKCPKVPYDAKKYFDSKYRATLNKEFSDRVMIWPDFDPLFARYHYNSIENGIIEYFASVGCTKQPTVLDIGSGAGHWIDFYLELFNAMSVVGIEISGICADALRKKYREIERVLIVEDDIASTGFRLGQKFDIINAIGVIFHIVDDHLWERAVKNLADHLNKKGTIVVSGQFGLVTQNVGFTITDEFSSWQECMNANWQTFMNADQEVAPVKNALVKKRVRSLRCWKRCARQYGLSVRRVHRTHRHRKIISPENNLLFLSAIP